MLTVLGLASPFSEDCTATALSFASSDMIGSNVLNDDLSRLWRGGGSAGGASAIIRFDFASDRFTKIDHLYLVGLNLDNFTLFGSEGLVVPEDYWEAWISDDPLLDVFQLPASIQEQTNFTTVGGFVGFDPLLTTQEGYAQTAAGTARIRVRFANPSPGNSGTTLTTGQLFAFVYKATGSGTINLTVRLKEAGTLRATLLTTSIAIVGTPNPIFIPWSGASLVAGIVPELELEVATTGTALVQFMDVVRWDVMIANDQPNHYHTGSIKPFMAPTFRVTDHVCLSSCAILPQAQAVKRIFLRLNRSAIVSDHPPEVGRIDGGLKLDFKMAANSWELTPMDDSVPIVMRDGSTRFHAREGYTQVTVRTPPELINKALEEKVGLALYAGVRRGLYWMFDSEDASKAPYTWFFGRLDQSPSFGNIQRFFTSGFSVRQIR